MFPAEDLLSTDVPVYWKEDVSLAVQILLATLLWFILVPTGVRPLLQNRSIHRNNDAEWGKVVTTKRSLLLSNNTHIYPIVTLLWITSSIGIVLRTTAHNAIWPRTVVTAPLWNPTECQTILRHALITAERMDYAVNAISNRIPFNDTVRALLVPPRGWHKLRYGPIYGTTDLNYGLDDFQEEHLQELQQLLSKRLGPLISRLYRVPLAAVRVENLQINRYEPGDVLEPHYDNYGDLAFVVHLNDQGIMQFWNGNTPFGRVTAQTGMVTLYHPTLVHETLVQSSSHERFVIAGLLTFDEKHAMTGRPTSLPWRSSWLATSWVYRRLQRGHDRKKQSWQRLVVEKAVASLTRACEEWLLSYRILQAIPVNKADEFMARLDQQYEQEQYIARLNAKYQQQQPVPRGELAAIWLPDTGLNQLRTFPGLQMLVAATSRYGALQKVPDGTSGYRVIERIRQSNVYADELDLPDDIVCRNVDARCSILASSGACERSFDYTLTYCPVTCQLCELVDYEQRCPSNQYKEHPVVQPGALDALFHRLVKERSETMRIHSKPNETNKNDGTSWLLELDKFLTLDECDELVAWGHELGFRSTYYHHWWHPPSQYRTSQFVWCTDQSGCRPSETVTNLFYRIEQLLYVPVEYIEDVQIVKYEPGEYHRLHQDSHPAMRDTQGGPRVVTILVYLSDVDEGGMTQFPHLSPAGQPDDPVTIVPEKGHAVLWTNVLSDDPWQLDDRMEHEALPVHSGYKFVANIWIRLYNYVDAKSSGCVVQ